MTIPRYSTSLHNSLEFIPGSHKRSNKHYFKGISFELYWEIIVLHNKCCRSILPTMYPAPGGKTSPCDYIRLGNISRERMVSVQNIDEGLIWGSVHIPILLSSTMVWIPWEKTAAFPYRNFKFVANMRNMHVLAMLHDCNWFQPYMSQEINIVLICSF